MVMAVETYSAAGNQRLSGNFTVGEFRCLCGCGGEFPLDGALIGFLQRIRDHFGEAVNISSGYRCPDYNAKVGGSPKSLHPKGKAADIWIPSLLHRPRVIAQYAESIGVPGIGLYENSQGQYFVHIDTRDTKTFWESHDERIVSSFQTQTIHLQLRVLGFGAGGADVQAMQRLLGVEADGSFGPATEAALRAWQRAQGLEADGRCGPLTWKRLLGRD